MAIRWGVAMMEEIEGRQGDMQRCRVRMPDGSLASALHDVKAFPPLKPGDVVLLNTTAEDLGLGSGGAHYVHAVLPAPVEPHVVSREKAPLSRDQGHIMKLRYTSLQRAVLAAEEPASPYHDVLSRRRRLYGMPVLIGELHSMLPVAVAWLYELSCRSHSPLPRIVYIMSDGGALPLGISRHTARLKELDWLAGTVTYGQAYGGDLEAVNKFTALLAARHVLHADIAMAVQGPGLVGTGTEYGHSGLETGELVNAVHVLGGKPVAVPRISFADLRDRHNGLSHHTVTALREAALSRALLPLPVLPAEQGRTLFRRLQASGLERKHEIRWQEAPPVEAMERAPLRFGPVTSMGRGVRADPAFFAAVCAAAGTALELLRPNPS
ncbi:DUF3866 family protein [Paenibacillus sp. P26]|nr:DUF3866 family protein [Paenibacillus sp. P26]